MFPGLVITDHSIEGDEHFAHQGNGGDLGGFASGDQAPVEVAERRLAAGGGTGGHVECGPHWGTSAGDGSCSLPLATVVIEGGKTDQGGDGAAGDAAELGQQSERMRASVYSTWRAIRAKPLRFWVWRRRQPRMSV